MVRPMRTKRIMDASECDNPMRASLLANPRTAKLHALVDGTTLHESAAGRTARLPSPEAIMDDQVRAFVERLHENRARRMARGL